MGTSELTQDYADSLSFIQSKISNRFRNIFIKKGCKEIKGIFKQSKIVDLKDLALVYFFKITHNNMHLGIYNIIIKIFLFW